MVLSDMHNNPFVSHHLYRYKIAWDLIPENTQTVLDYGAGNGGFLAGLGKKNNKIKLLALEVDPKKVAEIVKNRRVRVIKEKTGRVLLKDNSVDIVVMLDVLEHVSDEKMIIDEVWRLLKSGGRLILSVPHSGLTEVLDPGNIKFRFPRLHKFLYRRIFGEKEYAEKFGNEVLFGDISFQQKMWHRHYRLENLQKLLGRRFRITFVTYYGLLHTLWSGLNEVWWSVFRRKPRFLEKLYLKDTRTSFGRFSYSILIEAVKG